MVSTQNLPFPLSLHCVHGGAAGSLRGEALAWTWLVLAASAPQGASGASEERWVIKVTMPHGREEKSVRTSPGLPRREPGGGLGVCL